MKPVNLYEQGAWSNIQLEPWVNLLREINLNMNGMYVYIWTCIYNFYLQNKIIEIIV